MGGFLSTVFGWMFSAFLTWAKNQIQSFLGLIKQRSDTQKDAQQSVDPLKKAKTGDEIDKATPGALDGF